MYTTQKTTKIDISIENSVIENPSILVGWENSYIMLRDP